MLLFYFPPLARDTTVSEGMSDGVKGGTMSRLNGAGGSWIDCDECKELRRDV